MCHTEPNPFLDCVHVPSLNSTDQFIFFVCRDRRSGVPVIAVVFTNGNSENTNRTLDQASLVRRAGITIITVAADNWVDQYVLAAMASFPFQSNSIWVPKYTDLLDPYYVNLLSSIICNSQYHYNYISV